MPIDTDILSRAMDLPVQQRAELAGKLLLSLEEGPPDPEAERLWAEEAERRAEEIDSGKVEPVDWRPAIERIRSNLKRKSPQ